MTEQQSPKSEKDSIHAGNIADSEDVASDEGTQTTVIEGDIVHGDEVTGDKVMGNKIVIERLEVSAAPSHPTASPQTHWLHTGDKDSLIHILHLSGLHLATESEARLWRNQLATDLARELKVSKLNYLVLAGDIADSATPEEYDIASEFVGELAQRFEVELGHVIVVPGNHDVNWSQSENGYRFVYNKNLPDPLPKGQYIPAGEEGALLRDETLYQQRFAPFSEDFYSKVCGRDYPLDYADQGILHLYPDDQILFLGLNSCWEIDHHYRHRSSINMDALARALEQLHDRTYDAWLKIVVWHHPVTGSEVMKNIEFLDQLAVHGFQVCMVGHIYEPRKDPYDYDDQRRLHIIGAGVFGIPATWQASGIAMKYNLLMLDPATRTIMVETRKRDKPNGAWYADARWGDKNNPVPRYRINLK